MTAIHPKQTMKALSLKVFCTFIVNPSRITDTIFPLLELWCNSGNDNFSRNTYSYTLIVFVVVILSNPGKYSSNSNNTGFFPVTIPLRILTNSCFRFSFELEHIPVIQLVPVLFQLINRQPTCD